MLTKFSDFSWQGVQWDMVQGKQWQLTPSRRLSHVNFILCNQHSMLLTLLYAARPCHDIEYRDLGCLEEDHTLEPGAMQCCNTCIVVIRMHSRNSIICQADYWQQLRLHNESMLQLRLNIGEA